MWSAHHAQHVNNPVKPDVGNDNNTLLKFDTVCGGIGGDLSRSTLLTRSATQLTRLLFFYSRSNGAQRKYNLLVRPTL